MDRFGDAFGIAFAIEGIFFFLEAIFIAIYIYGWDRLSPRAHMLAAVPIVIAGIGGAFSVISANAWMNQPQGFELDAAGQPREAQNEGSDVTYRLVAEAAYPPGAGLPANYALPRDLDGDHALDIVVIDARLNVYHAFAATNFTFVGPTPLPITFANPQGFTQVATSVSGVPIP